MGDNYDRAVTIFSPDGHLLQVEYAQEAVRKGSTVAAVRTSDCIVMGAEKKASGELQLERTMRKIIKLDDHIMLTFAGLTADARVVINRAQVECQSHRLNFERAATVEFITRFIAQVKQKYTQNNGRRPFGLSCLIGGFNDDGHPRLYQTEPSGIYYEWTSNSTGRAGQTVREFMEKGAENPPQDEYSAIRYIIRSLSFNHQLTPHNMEVAVLKFKQPMRKLDEKLIGEHMASIKREDERESRLKQRMTT